MWSNSAKSNTTETNEEETLKNLEKLYEEEKVSLFFRILAGQTTAKKASENYQKEEDRIRQKSKHKHKSNSWEKRMEADKKEFSDDLLCKTRKTWKLEKVLGFNFLLLLLIEIFSNTNFWLFFLCHLSLFLKILVSIGLVYLSFGWWLIKWGITNGVFNIGTLKKYRKKVLVLLIFIWIAWLLDWYSYIIGIPLVYGFIVKPIHLLFESLNNSGVVNRLRKWNFFRVRNLKRMLWITFFLIVCLFFWRGVILFDSLLEKVTSTLVFLSEGVCK